jgi:hypothetical protein
LVFLRPARLESVGLDEQDRVESVAFEVDARSVVLAVANPHEQRAAEFSRRYRDFTTTEALSELAAEFERVARQEGRRERAGALRGVAEWCLERAAEDARAEESREEPR